MFFMDLPHAKKVTKRKLAMSRDNNQLSTRACDVGYNAQRLDSKPIMLSYVQGSVQYGKQTK